MTHLRAPASLLVLVPLLAADAAAAPTDPLPGETGRPLDLLGPSATAIALHSPWDGTDGDHAGRPDDHAPIGVMGDHMHHAGEWMLSVRRMSMHMDGMRDGSSGLSAGEVFARNFPVTPTEMDTDMWMLGGMWAPTDEVTLMVMVPYLRRTMDHQTGGGALFTTRSGGLGDVSVSGLVRAWEDGPHHVHWNLGVSLPTGSIDERDDTPASGGFDVTLPYPMQLGTGTFDLLPGVTYTGKSVDTSWGAQATARLPVENTNDNGYRRGTRGEITGWIAQRFSEETSGSVRLRYAKWNPIRGADPDLNPAMVPTADPALQGGRRVDLLVGMNWIEPDEGSHGHRLAFEVGVPIDQHLQGPQLETDWTATVGWQKAF